MPTDKVSKLIPTSLHARTSGFRLVLESLLIFEFRDWGAPTDGTQNLDGKHCSRVFTASEFVGQGTLYFSIEREEERSTPEHTVVEWRALMCSGKMASIHLSADRM